MSGRAGSRLLDPEQTTQIDYEDSTTSGLSGRIKVVIIVLLVVGLVIGLLSVIFVLTASPEHVCPVHQTVSVDNVKQCLDNLQIIANTYGNRAVGQPGYRASVEYILARLASTTHLNVTEQSFFITNYSTIGTPTLAVVDYEHPFVFERDFILFSGSPSGKSDGAALTFVGEGCTLEAYKDFPPGNVALVKRGNCSFNDKGQMAFDQKASAIIVFNTDPSVLATRMATKIPAFSAAGWVGTVLTSFLDNVTIAYEVNVTAFQVETWNIIAETLEGDPTKKVVLGSHLDGVPAGSGINDNGSGSCMNLELALTTAKTCSPNQKITFAWWGAEEIGLLGSHHYLNAMTLEEKNKIALNMNFDMMASPNYVLGVFNGTTAPEAIKPQSVLIQQQLEKYFTTSNTPYKLSPMGASSDYYPFLFHGIPAGGLATGAGAIKTYEERDMFGGLALVAYDNCYHQSCDTTKNIHPFALESNLKSSATALEIFAVDTALVDSIHTINQAQNIKTENPTIEHDKWAQA